jgi:hypothetical protein
MLEFRGVPITTKIKTGAKKCVMHFINVVSFFNLNELKASNNIRIKKQKSKGFEVAIPQGNFMNPPMLVLDPESNVDAKRNKEI